MVCTFPGKIWRNTSVYMKSYTTCMYTYIHITHCLYRCIQRWWHLQEDTEKTTERKVYGYMQTALYILVILTQSKKSRYCFGWVTKSVCFLWNSRWSPSTTCTKKRRRIQGLHGLHFLPEIQFDWALQFLNSTPQNDERRALAAVLLGLLEDC